jgi:hypothetical protein
MVRPAVNEEQVRNAASLPWEQLRPEFREKMDAVRRDLMRVVEPKTLFGSLVTGPVLVRLAQSYIKTMNTSGVVPTIKGAWEYVVITAVLLL